MLTKPAHASQVRAARLLIAGAALFLFSNRAQAQVPGVVASRTDSTRRAIDTVEVTGRIDDLIGRAKSASEGRVGAVEYGDFGSAAGAEFHLMRSLDRPFATVETGANGFARLATGGSTRIGVGTLLIGGEAKTYDGPWTRSQDIRKFGGMARYTYTMGASQLSILAWRTRINEMRPIRLRVAL